MASEDKKKKKPALTGRQAFDQAFGSARNKLGRGKTFDFSHEDWTGGKRKSFTTEYAEEKKERGNVSFSDYYTKGVRPEKEAATPVASAPAAAPRKNKFSLSPGARSELKGVQERPSSAAPGAVAAVKGTKPSEPRSTTAEVLNQELARRSNPASPPSHSGGGSNAVRGAIGAIPGSLGTGKMEAAKPKSEPRSEPVASAPASPSSHPADRGFLNRRFLANTARQVVSAGKAVVGAVPKEPDSPSVKIAALVALKGTAAVTHRVAEGIKARSVEQKTSNIENAWRPGTARAGYRGARIPQVSTPLPEGASLSGGHFTSPTNVFGKASPTLGSAPAASTTADFVAQLAANQMPENVAAPTTTRQAAPKAPTVAPEAAKPAATPVAAAPAAGGDAAAETLRAQDAAAKVENEKLKAKGGTKPKKAAAVQTSPALMAIGAPAEGGPTEGPGGRPLVQRTYSYPTEADAPVGRIFRLGEGTQELIRMTRTPVGSKVEVHKTYQVPKKLHKSAIEAATTQIDALIEKGELLPQERDISIRHKATALTKEAQIGVGQGSPRAAKQAETRARAAAAEAERAARPDAEIDAERGRARESRGALDPTASTLSNAEVSDILKDFESETTKPAEAAKPAEKPAVAQAEPAAEPKVTKGAEVRLTNKDLMEAAKIIGKEEGKKVDPKSAKVRARAQSLKRGGAAVIIGLGVGAATRRMIGNQIDKAERMGKGS